MSAEIKMNYPTKKKGKTSLTLIYVVTGFLSLFVFSVALLPAAPVWNTIGQDPLAKKLPTVKIGRISGTIWAGSAVVRIIKPELLPLKLHWQLTDISFRDPGLTYFVTIKSNQLNLESSLTIQTNRLRLSNLVGSIDANKISHLTSQYGFKAEGIYYLKPTELLIENMRIQDVDGFIGWTGGLLSIETEAASLSLVYSEMGGQLTIIDQIPRVTILEGNKPLLRAEISPDGWLKIQSSPTVVMQGQKLKGNSPLEKGFTYEEKLW